MRFVWCALKIFSNNLLRIHSEFPLAQKHISKCRREFIAKAIRQFAYCFFVCVWTILFSIRHSEKSIQVLNIFPSENAFNTCLAQLNRYSSLCIFRNSMENELLTTFFFWLLKNRLRMLFLASLFHFSRFFLSLSRFFSCFFFL